MAIEPTRQAPAVLAGCVALCWSLLSIALATAGVNSSWFGQEDHLRSSHEHTKCVAFSPDGRLLATAGSPIAFPSPDPDGCEFRAYQLWDAVTLRSRRIGNFDGVLSVVESMAFSPSGDVLALGLRHALDKEGCSKLQFVEATTGKHLATLALGGDGATSLAFSPDGKSLVVGDIGKRVFVFDVKERKSILELKVEEGPEGVCFAPDGKSILVSYWKDTAGIIQRYSFPGGKEVAKVETKHKGLRCSALSPDGKSLATGGQDGSVNLWDTEGLKVRSELGDKSNGAVVSLAFTPDAKRLLTGHANGRIITWDLAKKQAIFTFRGHRQGVSSLAVSADGKKGVSAAGECRICVWDLTTGREDARSLSEYRNSVCTFGYAPDGQTFLTAGTADALGNGLARWDANTGKSLKLELGRESLAWCMSFSRDGQLLATGGTQGEAFVWDSRRWERRAALVHQGGSDIQAIAFSPDARTLATGGEKGAVFLWDWAKGELRATHQVAGKGTTPSSIHLLHFLDDKRLLVGPMVDGSAAILDVATGKAKVHLRGPRGRISRAAVSADGKTIATGSGGDDTTIRLWDTNTGKQLGSFEGHTESVTAVAFTPDGKLLLSSSRDGTVRCWDLKAAKEVARLRPYTGINRTFGPDVDALALSPDGKEFVTQCVWRTQKWSLAAVLRDHAVKPAKDARQP